MTRTKEKMTCPDCGVELNHHAKKIVTPVGPEDAAHVDPDLGGMVLEAHSCPECGKTAGRLA